MLVSDRIPCAFFLCNDAPMSMLGNARWRALLKLGNARCRALVCATFAVACSDPSQRSVCSTEPGSVDSALVNGASHEEFLGLADEEIAAIVEISDAPWPTGSVCTGALIRPNWVITARHCLVIENPLVHIRRAAQVVTSSRVVRSIAHPTLDVGLLEIDPAAAVEDGVRPLSVSTASDIDWLGQRVELAGYGLTQTNMPAGLRFAVEGVVELSDTMLRVDGLGRSGACEGDSGGPVLARSRDGRPVVLGTLSSGAASCVGRDSFIRTDAVAPWLDANLPEAGPDSAVACGQITSDGKCLYGAALRCVDHQLSATPCESGQVCGWDFASASFGCVSADADPCQGAGSLGMCDGNVAVTCVAGERVSHDCAACGKCQLAASNGSPRCAAALDD